MNICYIFFLQKLFFWHVFLLHFFLLQKQNGWQYKIFGTHDMWHIWGGWTLSQDFSSLAFTEFEYFCHSMTVKDITFDKAYPIPYSQLHKIGLDVYIDATA